MTIALTPEIGVPVPPVLQDLDLRLRAESTAATAALLQEHGLEVEETDVSNEIAATLALSYAKDPVKTSKAATNQRTATLPPASIIKVNDLLQEFGTLVAREAEQVRNLVVNRLLLESANDDPKIRIKALELIGKMSGIDLFTERKEVTIKHASSEELKEKLREKLEKLKGEDPMEGEFEELPPILGGEELDVDEILGTKPENPVGEAPASETHPVNEVPTSG